MTKIMGAIAPLWAALLFYTSLPLPFGKALEFRHVARLAPVVGLIIGGVLVGLDAGLAWLGLNSLLRCVLVVLSGLSLTGGLHLDGAMDAADGLAVQDPQRRLQVMSDSVTGAFGVMVAIALLWIKPTALVDVVQWRWLALMLVPGWGRWSQQVAIARYPYLKPTGKGAFHKESIQSFSDTVPCFILLLSLSLLPCLLHLANWTISLGLALGGAIALSVPAWFHQQLGGHTGDTYGASVEWTEALHLILLSVLL